MYARAGLSAEEANTSTLCAAGDKMDTAYLSALAGTAVGGLTSFFGSWLGQSAQFKAQLFLQEKGRRQELYRDFVEEASKVYIDALTNDQPDLSKTIVLYALLSRMRILSSPKVVEEADKVVRLIVDSYPRPNKTFSELRLGRAVNPLITLLNDPPVVSGQHVPVVPRHRHIDRRLKTLFPCSERVGPEFGRRAALNERGGVGKDIINEGGRTKIELHRHVGAAGNR